MYDVNHRVLSRDEVYYLVPLAQKGCIESRDRLIESNIRLVAKVANKYREVLQNCEVEDLIQEGTIGLMKAIEKFDISKGTEFSTYAKFWIDKYIINHFNETKKVRLPSWVYAENLQDEKTLNILSIDEDLGEGKNRHDLIAVENKEIEHIENKDYLKSLFRVLTDIEKKVMKARMEGITLKAIGTYTGKSQERIRQIEIRAYRKLKAEAKLMTLREAM